MMIDPKNATHKYFQVSLTPIREIARSQDRKSKGNSNQQPDQKIVTVNCDPEGDIQTPLGKGSREPINNWVYRNQPRPNECNCQSVNQTEEKCYRQSEMMSHRPPRAAIQSSIGSKYDRLLRVISRHFTSESLGGCFAM